MTDAIKDNVSGKRFRMVGVARALQLRPCYFTGLPYLVLGWSLLALSQSQAFAADTINLALHKPASSSSIENDEHNAAQANDGDPATSWCADDEPEGGPEWWQVDLEKSCELTGCQIRWPFQGKKYQYKVEGSADRKKWSVLSDQTTGKSTKQVHNLKFEKSGAVRYVKITVTGFDEGCWASISEVKIFGVEHSKGDSR